MSEKNLHHEKFIVTGMTCSACSAHVEKSVRHVDGVCAVSVNLLNGSMVVDYDDTASPDKIVAAVVEGGYGAELASQSKKDGQRDAIAALMRQPLADELGRSEALSDGEVREILGRGGGGLGPVHGVAGSLQK